MDHLSILHYSLQCLPSHELSQPFLEHWILNLLQCLK